MGQPVVLSWSGGKDSCLALAVLREDPRFDVVGLLTSITRGYDRISIHGVRRALLEQQASALALPVFEVALEPSTTNEAYEHAFRDATHPRGVVVREERFAYCDLLPVSVG